MSKEDKWELSVVENAGEIPNDAVTDEVIAINTEKILADIDNQLSFKPKNFNYTIGWRAIVWKEKETGRFQELTEEEHRSFLERGTADFTRGDSQDGGDSGDSSGVEGTTA